MPFFNRNVCKILTFFYFDPTIWAYMTKSLDTDVSWLPIHTFHLDDLSKTLTTILERTALMWVSCLSSLSPASSSSKVTQLALNRDFFEGAGVKGGSWSGRSAAVTFRGLIFLPMEL